MKKIYLLMAISGLLFSCNPTDEKLEGSNLDINTPNLNTTDQWLRDNYTTPYNIEVTYKWDEGRVDLNRYLHPPYLENVIPVMEIVKTIWLDTYSQVGGADFVKKIAPRELVLVGGKNLNEDGTRTLGFAEGGKNIVLFEADLIDLKSKASVIRFVETIQHEYTHILNQTVRFDEEAFKQITPADYTAQWFNPANETERVDIANSLGFISDYSRLNHTEDFAEMVTALLSNSATEYAALLSNIRTRIINKAVTEAVAALGSGATAAQIQIATDAATVTATPNADKAVSLIRQKEAIVADYFKREFQVDIYELQRVASENILKAIN
ncbi:substrate import-associated zinc metallohydrolase lipoprotein [Tenacibaculum sp. 190524A02b]|uniref:substrate import-associated zinc metallohydrolase lipoprotein n=1 Tax=Tenacibaculum vairaonense TaxID=3137860 RepID=UPI0031FB6ED9